MDAIKIVEQAFAQNKAAQYPEFKAGDTITVVYKVKEGDKERLQKFRGVVIQISGATPFTRTFTVRKVASGVGVERIFPYESPFIDSIELNKVGKVRRAKLYFLRALRGGRIRDTPSLRCARSRTELGRGNDTAVPCANSGIRYDRRLGLFPLRYIWFLG